MRCWALFPLTYIVCAMLTFAWIYDDGWSDDQYHQTDRQFSSFAGAVSWPIYWSGKGALYVVRAAKTGSKSAKACMDADGNSWAPEDGVCRFKRKESSVRPEMGNNFTASSAIAGMVCQVNTGGVTLCTTRP